jgi:aconitate hydratase
MAAYLKATNRADIAEMADKNRDILAADEDIEKNPEKYFDKIIELNLSQLEPYIVGPHTPDLARPISRLARDVKEKNYPDKITSALIGSCTNSSYEDLSRVADVAAQAKAAYVKSAVKLMVSPGSDQIYETIKRDGQAQALEDIGATVLANACGPCIGQWKRDDIKSGEKNSILTSFNRNFPKRNDGNSETLAFIASPEIVVAIALAGRLSFNPLTDTLETQEGKQVKLSAPKKAEDLPKKGFIAPLEGYIAPSKDGGEVSIIVDPQSERLQLLQPFSKWDGKDFIEIPILLKAKGKCTTDHISPAGPWLKYRGHLDKISDNMLIGAISAFTG